MAFVQAPHEPTGIPKGVSPYPKKKKAKSSMAGLKAAAFGAPKKSAFNDKDGDE